MHFRRLITTHVKVKKKHFFSPLSVKIPVKFKWIREILLSLKNRRTVRFGGVTSVETSLTGKGKKRPHFFLVSIRSKKRNQLFLFTRESTKGLSILLLPSTSHFRTWSLSRSCFLIRAFAILTSHIYISSKTTQ